MFDANIRLAKALGRRFPGCNSDAIAREFHPTSPFLAEPYNLKYQSRKRQIITAGGFEVNLAFYYLGVPTRLNPLTSATTFTLLGVNVYVLCDAEITYVAPLSIPVKR